MKRTLGLSTIILGAVATLGVQSPAAADHLGGEDFKVIARVISERDIDTGPKGPTAGDYFIFNEKLMKHGKRVGSAAGRCDLIRATRRVYSIQCFLTLTFKGKGQLTAQGAVTFREGKKNDDPTLAITGGTGDYTGAAGEFVVLDRRDGPPRYRIHLAA